MRQRNVLSVYTSIYYDRRLLSTYTDASYMASVIARMAKLGRKLFPHIHEIEFIAYMETKEQMKYLVDSWFLFTDFINPTGVLDNDQEAIDYLKLIAPKIRCEKTLEQLFDEFDSRCTSIFRTIGKAFSYG